MSQVQIEGILCYTKMREGALHFLSVAGLALWVRSSSLEHSSTSTIRPMVGSKQIRPVSFHMNSATKSGDSPTNGRRMIERLLFSSKLCHILRRRTRDYYVLCGFSIYYYLHTFFHFVKQKISPYRCVSDEDNGAFSFHTQGIVAMVIDLLTRSVICW